MPRKNYTREFKLQALRMLTDQGLCVAEVARRLGVGENCLRNWRSAAQEQGEAASPAEWSPRGCACRENTVAGLRRAQGPGAGEPRRFAPTTGSGHGLPVAENVLGRDFDPGRPNAAWSADITYIPTEDGWPYLAVVGDLFSRMIVGRSMGETMTSRLVAAAPGMALRRRLPEEGLLAHSDRGGASTPASTTNASWAGTGSPAA